MKASLDTNRMKLSILNENAANVLSYLPHGVTTVEMKIQGDKSDEMYGFIYPEKRADPKKKMYVGYADQNEDFFVLWGAGKEGGLNISPENIGGRIFLQILHKGKSDVRQNISLCHSNKTIPICVMKLVPADESPNLVKMELKKQQGNEYQIISFVGNRMPYYYSRWFPPRPSENNKIQYSDTEVPLIEVKFKVKDEDGISNVDSDIDITLDNEKIAEVTGDWRYSWPHAEVFTVFGDSDYLVLRLWLYWIHKNFSKNILRNSNDPAQVQVDRETEMPQANDQTKRGLLESFNIECPDNERFDFLIDMRKKRVTWMGTDFHYQESWYKFEDNEQFVQARIANDFNTIEQVFLRLKDRYNQVKENYDPMIHLKEMLERPDLQGNLTLEDMTEMKEKVDSNRIDAYRGVGFTRKHVPYPQNGCAVAELVSSIVTS